MVKSDRAEPSAAPEKRGILMLRRRGSVALWLLLAAPTVFAQTAASPTAVAAPTASAPTAADPSTAGSTAEGPAATPPVTSAATHRVAHKTQKPIPKALELPPMPSGPLSQLPMDQIPAAPAKVSFQGGLLTITAQNSTLGEILRDVHKLTGAVIEIPPGLGANERVVTHIGPAAPRDVLAVLLNGSSFNYVMVGSSSDPGAVSSVILSAKPLGPGDPQPQVQTAANVYETSPAPMRQMGVPQPFVRQNVLAGQAGANGQPGAARPGDEAKDDEDKDDDDTADDQAQPLDSDGAAPNGNAQDQPQQPDPNQPNAGPKTPEQIMEMLRRQQQPGGPGVPPQPPGPAPAQPPQQQ
jgi:hypothetical protein